MILGRTKDNLEILQDKDEITIEEALKFFASFCEDIKSESGRTIEQQNIGNKSEAIKKIRWMGRVAIRSYEKNRDQIESRDSVEYLDQLTDEINASAQKAEKIEEQLLLLSEKKQQLESEHRRLDEKAKKLADIQEKSQELEEKCKSLENDISGYNTTRLPELEKKCNDLKNRWEELNEIYRETQIKCSEIEEICSQYTDQKEELLKKEEGLKEQAETLLSEKKKIKENIEEYEALIKRETIMTESLNSQIENYKIQIVEIKQKMEETENQAEKKKAENDNFENDLKKLSEKLEKEEDRFRDLDAKNKELEELIRESQEGSQRAAEVYHISQKRLNVIQDEWSRTKGENKEIQEKIERLREYLSNSNITQLRLTLQKKFDEKAELQKQCDDINEQIEVKEQEIHQLKKKHQEENAVLEEIKWKKEQEGISSSAETDRIKGEIKAVEEKKNKLIRENQDVKEELARLNMWHKSAEPLKYKEELENNIKLCSILEEARQAMEEDLADYSQEKELAVQYYFRNEIKEIREKLDRYQKKYKEAIDTIPIRKVLK